MHKILFFATEDWFVRSHFLPLLKRARDDGFEVVVAARASGALSDIGDVRVIDTPFARGSMQPWELWRQIMHLRDLLQREKPQIVHAIALKPAALLSMSGWREGGRVFAVTGRGSVAAGNAGWRQQLDSALRTALRGSLAQPRALLLVENSADRDWLSVRGDLDAKTLIMPGAGVDPDIYRPMPAPPAPPHVVGVVARLIGIKGIDVAVAAVQHLRERGQNITLRVAGDVDAESPDRVSAADIASWRSLDGVELVGRASNVSDFWANTHIACLPSRGGEGLPRSLLEAAACGRAIVTTDAPGCRDFVTGDIGLAIPCGDVAALADALKRLAHDADTRSAMGAAARAKVVEGYTERHAADVAARAWTRVFET